MTSTLPLTPLCVETPTVTLEVMAQTAAVSQWSSKPVVQVRRFHLQIRSVHGDEPPVHIRGDRDDLLTLQTTIQGYIQAQLAGVEAVEISDRPPDGPYIVSQGLTYHHLHLGPLASREAGRVPLAVVQLTDLGHVFDQLDSQVRLLPISLPPAVRLPWQRWGTVAAGIIAAVGLTTALWPLHMARIGPQQTAFEGSGVSEDGADPPGLRRSESAPETQESALSTDDSATTSTPAAASSPTAPGSEVAAQTDEVPTNQEPLPSPAAPADTTTTPTLPTESPATTDTQPQDLSVPAPAANPSDPQSFPRSGEGPPSTDSSDSSPEAAAGITADTTPSPQPPQPPAAPIEAGSPAGQLRQPFSPSAISLEELEAVIQERWQPPVELEQALAYTLIVAATGELVEIIPDNDLANRYRDRVGLPQLGTSLEAPPNGQSIRVVLWPNGRVDVSIATVDQP